MQSTCSVILGVDDAKFRRLRIHEVHLDAHVWLELGHVCCFESHGVERQRLYSLKFQESP